MTSSEATGLTDGIAKLRATSARECFDQIEVSGHPLRETVASVRRAYGESSTSCPVGKSSRVTDHN